jgi:signal transduction histidine kinase
MGTQENRTQTLEQLLEQLSRGPLAELPLSIYVADAQGDLAFCNAEARTLLDLPAESGLSGSIADFYRNPEQYAALVEEAGAPQTVPGRAPAQRVLVPLVVSGREVYVEQYLSAIPCERSREQGLFVGCMVDVTDDQIDAQHAQALQNTVRELTFDIGQILHANTSTLVMVNQTLMAASRALEPELDDDEQASRPELLDADLAKRATRLLSSLSRLIEAGDPERRSEALAAERWQELEVLVSSLEGYRDNIPVPEMRVSALRAMTNEILRACRDLEPGHMPREVVRETVRAAQELQRLTCFMDIVSTRAAVLQMDISLTTLRDFITTEVRADDPKARVTVASIIREAIAHLAEFMRAARVEVVWRNRSEDIEVFGNRRDLLRAVTNLLHNAVKYSWKREGYEAPWVALEVHEGDGTVSIEIENWGVPVEVGEIEADLVFDMGYRGKRSKDRGRLGTGIGLTDSQRVAEAHGGSLTMASKPARASSPDPNERDYYRQPFLTRVRMTLPISA